MEVVRLLRQSSTQPVKITKKSHVENIGRHPQSDFNHTIEVVVKKEPDLSNESCYEDIEILDEYLDEVKPYLDSIKVEEIVPEESSIVKTEDNALKEEEPEPEDVKPLLDMSCTFCSKKFTNSAKHAAHEKLHSTDVLYCSICDIHFQVKAGKIQHDAKRHNATAQFECAHCTEIFPDKRTLLTHLEYKCIGLTTRPQLTKMRKGKADADRDDIDWSSVNGAPPPGFTIRNWLLLNTKKKIMCELCGRTTSTDYSAMQHSYTIHGAIPAQYKELWRRNNFTNQCPRCDKSFDQLSKFYIHQQIHRLETYTCDVCGTLLKGIKSFRKHQASHGPKLLECPNCDKKFSHRERLTVHLKEKHSLTEQYVCKLCDQMFKYGTHYRDHMRDHRIPNYKKCEICLKDYASRSSLRSHLHLKHPEVYGYWPSKSTTKE